ncbi:hypothetical protein V492_04800, partial [Pseudogymnoascus sp. VKM F-4246]
MVRLSLLAVLIAASITPSTAFVWTPAKATPAAKPIPSIIPRFKPPKPTQAADSPYDILSRRNVRRAASSDDATTAFMAPDATCGYFDGRPGASLKCGTSNTCFMFTSAAGNGYIGCCPIRGSFDDCGFRFGCVGAADLKNGTFCDSGCLQDAYTLKCTQTSAPYCGYATWPLNGVSDYFCDSKDITTTQTLYTSYRGQTGHTWFSTTLTDQTALTSSRTGNAGTNAPEPTGDSTSSDGASPTDGSDNSNSDNSNDSNNHSTTKKKSTPVGPIVGGVIGG